MLRVLLFSFIIISCPLASYSQQINISGDRFHLYGPNSTGNEYLKIGGNGRGPGHASLVTTNGNLFIDSKNERELYLNHHSRRNTYINPSGGNVGIGTLDPKSRLEVNGTIRSSSNILAANPSNQTAIVFLGWRNNVARIRIGGNGEGAAGGLDIQTLSDKSLLRVLGNGNVGIGTASPDTKLAVNGNIRAREIKLEAENWPDYVFEKDYPLMSLEELDSFISEHGHLPGFKGRDEYLDMGVNMLEMNIRLLEKVEELTLHTIKQQKELEELKFRFGILPDLLPATE